MQFFVHAIAPDNSRESEQCRQRGDNFGIWEHAYPAPWPCLYRSFATTEQEALTQKRTIEEATSHLPDVPCARSLALATA